MLSMPYRQTQKLKFRPSIATVFELDAIVRQERLIAASSDILICHACQTKSSASWLLNSSQRPFGSAGFPKTRICAKSIRIAKGILDSADSSKASNYSLSMNSRYAWARYACLRGIKNVIQSFEVKSFLTNLQNLLKLHISLISKWVADVQVC